MKKMHGSLFLTCISSLSLLHAPLSAEAPSQEESPNLAKVESLVVRPKRMPPIKVESTEAKEEQTTQTSPAAEDPSNDNHVVVDSRPLPSEKIEEMIEKRQQEALENAANKPADSAQNARRLSQVTQKSLRPSRLGSSQRKNFLFSTPKTAARHWLASISGDTTCLELEDGSHWKTSGNAYSFWGWRSGDLLEVTPNQSMWSQYKYYITNKYTGSYVAADLFVGPIAFGPYTHWIAGIDHTLGKVFLENGSAWTISDSDAYLFNNWAINDTVIIGSNDSWFTSYDTLLINVNMNCHVRALQY